MKNPTAAVIGWLVPLVVFLFLTPFLIHRLGVEIFGIFALTNVLTGYVAFLNFGFGQAVVKQVAHFAANNEEDRLADTVTIALLFFLLVGTSGFLLIYLIAPWLSHSVFNISTDNQQVAIATFRWAAFGFLFNMLSEALRGLCIGVNDFTTPNVSRISRVVLSSLLMVVAVLLGGGLPEVMIGNITGQFLIMAVVMVFVLRIFPSFSFRFSPSLFMEMFHFSKFVFFSKGLNMFASQLGVVLLGMFTNMSQVTYYDVPMKIARRSLEVFSRLFELLFPISAALKSQEKNTKLSELYISVCRFQLILLIPLFALFTFHGKWLLRFWLSEEFVMHGYSILIVASLISLLSMLSNLPSFFALGLGAPQYTTLFTGIRIVVLLITMYPLMIWKGGLGIALSLLVGALQGVVFIEFAARKLLHIRIFANLKSYLLRLGLIALVFLVGYLLVGDWLDSHDSMIFQILFGVGLMLFYSVMLHVSGLLPLKRIVAAFKTRDWTGVFSQ